MQTQITCPSTGAALSFDIKSDEDTVVSMWQQPVRIACPVCGSIHETPYRDVYVAGLMGQFQCLPADVKEGRVH